MKVYVSVINTLSGISQYGKIEEPVKKGLEIQNALMHFGINNALVKWFSETQPETNAIIKSGMVDGTNKIVSIVAI